MIVRGEERRLKKRVIKILRNKEEEERVKIKTKVQVEVVCERKERERGGCGKQYPLATV